MINCEECGKEIPDPKKNRNGLIQRFCDDRCRWAFHYRKKFERLQEELMALFKKYGFLK